jgi:hypothetical protein
MADEKSNIGGVSFLPSLFMPGADGNYVPCPAILTESEAIRFLRLAEIGIKNPGNTLRYYRNLGILRATRIGNRNVYTVDSLVELVKTLTEKTYERRRR